MRSRIFLLGLVGFLLHAWQAESAITFNNSFWSTSFNQATTGDAMSSWSYNGLVIEDNYTCNGLYSHVTETATTASGAAGKVFSVYMSGNNRNTMSTPPTIRFGNPQKEIWLRFYYRIPVGQSIGGIQEHKLIYAFTDGGVAANVNWPEGANDIMLQPRNTMGNPDIVVATTGGWASVYGAGSAPADGSWHYFEFHFDLGTLGGNNGVFEMWVDGVRRAYRNNLDWFNGGSAHPTGWSYITVPSNHNVWTKTGCNPHDLDQIAVALPAYAGFVQDATGRKMIGGLSTSGTTPSPVTLPPAPSSVLFVENFEDSNIGSRGWYDNTNLVLSSVEHVSGSSSSAEFRFQQGDSSPTSGGAIRKKFTDSDSVYISYYIKHSSNWVGSNVDYHPHQFYFMTNLDNDYLGPSVTHLTAYVEENDGYPLMLIQDTLNIDQGRIGQNLIGVTENRATGGCNGSTDDGHDFLDCYGSAGNYRNEKKWKPGIRYFQNTQGQYYKGDWHRVEAFFKLNTVQNGVGLQDGVVQYWYDGVVIMDYKNVILRTAQNQTMKFNKLLIAPYIGAGSPVDQSFWIDDLTIATVKPVAGLGSPEIPIDFKAIP